MRSQISIALNISIIRMRISKLASLKSLKPLIISFILGLFIISSILYFNYQNKISRDQQRISDIKKIQIALNKFYNDHNHYPDAQSDILCDRWDVGFWQKHGSDGFINLLVKKNYLKEPIGDPLFYGNCNQGYFYHRYYCNNNSPVYPCYGSDKPFYILGIKKLETNKFKNQSLGFKCPNRNFTQEFDYVIGDWEK